VQDLLSLNPAHLLERYIRLASHPSQREDPRDWTCGFISRADVADFLVKQIDDDAFLHKTPMLVS
jgi:hypothetical protein